MRRVIGMCSVCALIAATSAWGQAEDSVYDSTYVARTASVQQEDMEMEEDVSMALGEERYLRSPLFFDDAQVQPTGSMDFRIRTDYKTESGHSIPQGGREGSTDDDFGVGLSWYWGPCENVEVFADLPINMGDGWDSGDGYDGNYDLSVGMTYQFWDEEELAEWMPAFALKGTLRTPTGYHSNGFDGELRGLLTKTIAGDLRGHFNAFAATINGNNDPDLRHFQWGFVIGVDMPLSDARDLWLMLDYMHRSSEHYGNGNMNLAEVGVEWKLDDCQSIHATMQAGLDGVGDTPNWGGRLAYTYELRYQ